MARTPQTNEAFLREVDEELRRDQLARLWKSWGRLLIVVIAVGLVLFGGWLWWRDHQAKQAGAEGERLNAAIEQLSRNQVDPALPALKGLAASDRPGYRAAAQLASASIAAQKGDIQTAVDTYAGVAKDEKVGQPFRDLALIRQTTTQFDTLPPDQVIQRMRPLAQKGQPWFGSAGELLAVAQLKAGRSAEAGATFAALAADPAVPSSIRSRSAQMASVLGLDMSAAPAPSLAR
ncbi:tetratricopeptide repeat protein [Sphingomonas sp. ID1715]|uniref:tetratricopeptide repeat protein n=1 Tax=Sphingomonas sp. ID1715 TaxID=1656898 RepID=UPI0014898D28|nr:tetratricopeptide repeat protein [Sphingomonas sp. ID1715]NNM75962.1 tetratricopeptide repeat protein [Sphingomonas sp. ID1715]